MFKGTVERIGGRSTEIRTLDHVAIIVPNSRFLETEVINWSHSNPVSRLHLPVGVAYGSDPRKVEAALLEAADQDSKVLKTPPPKVLFKGFGDSALNFELLVWTAEPDR
jgi:small-conductance mechanosensitive channel